MSCDYPLQKWETITSCYPLYKQLCDPKDTFLPRSYLLKSFDDNIRIWYSPFCDI